MREVSIFYQIHVYKYCPIKVVSLPPTRKISSLNDIALETGTQIPNEQAIYNSCCSTKLRSCFINTIEILSSILG